VLLRNRSKVEDICARYSAVSKRPGIE